MANVTIYTKMTRGEVKGFAQILPKILAGKAADPHKIAKGIALRTAFTFFSLVKRAFIVKSRGGTDDAGIKWNPLSLRYLAYGSKNGRKGIKGPGKAPGNKNGFMNQGQLNQWRMDYARNLKWLSAREDINVAKASAAKIAWSNYKKAGGKTKLSEAANRKVEVLRDRGVLFNSLQPGTLSESNASASYSPPANQVVTYVPGSVVVGTKVKYATYHHNAKNPKRRRPLWPEKLPQAWRDAIDKQLTRGMQQAISYVAKVWRS